MEALTLKKPQEMPEVESWDDDDFANLDDVQIRTASTATSTLSHPQSTHRDSISSRLSFRSDSNQGDENWDVLVDEQASIKDAVALAKSKGIPLPTNIPRSALEGGTIRRLKGKEIKKVISDDWSEDLDLSPTAGPLTLVKPGERDLSNSLRQLSAAFHKSPSASPEQTFDFTKTVRSPKSRTAATPVSLAAFQDVDEEDGFNDIPTIRIAKQRSPQKPTLIQPPKSTKPVVEAEELEKDLELPTDGQLRLSTRKPVPKTPQQGDDFDLEWAEGSLGTRHAGTKRGGRSVSSSASALSPSVSSAFTGESEDEGMIGLVLPDGPLRLEEALRKRQEQKVPEQPDFNQIQSTAKPTSKEDFFDDFEIGDGDVFDAAKLTLNRNIKHKTQRSTSPAKQRMTTTLNFTTKKTESTISRLPRFQPAHDRHERARPKLEPVSETNVVSRYQRPPSRLGNHSAQSSVPAIPSAPSTPSKRGLRGTESQTELRYNPPTTTNADLLRAKRSMPAIRNLISPTKPQIYPRPPSRQDGSGFIGRLNFTRPKTPTERAESRLGEARKPFLPAGASTMQSQHVNIKNTTTRHYRRNDSEGSNDSMSAAQRSLSRLAGLTPRPETPGRGRSSLTPAELAAQAKKPITKPARRRNFGDGTELDAFDDLPTSATVESKFTKLPDGRGAPRSLRSRLGLGMFQSNSSTTSLATTRAGTETPLPITPITPARSEFMLPNSNVPRFARDTAASRNAREQRQISSVFQNMRGEPLKPLSTNWQVHANARPPPLLKKKGKTQQKPHLIKPLGDDVNRPKSEKGMHYNPDLYRWEGNEGALDPFDVPDFHPREGSPNAGGSPGGKANVALIAGTSMTGVQVVGGMVFDPRRMCWLKVAENSETTLRGGMDGVQIEEEEDVFAGLEDLKEEDETASRSVFSGHGKDRDEKADQDGSSGDEFAVAEEFDVGPEFVRRQRVEEERWKRKVEKWVRNDLEVEEDERVGGWRWAIRDLVLSDVS